MMVQWTVEMCLFHIAKIFFGTEKVKDYDRVEPLYDMYAIWTSVAG